MYKVREKFGVGNVRGGKSPIQKFTRMGSVRVGKVHETQTSGLGFFPTKDMQILPPPPVMYVIHIHYVCICYVYMLNVSKAQLSSSVKTHKFFFKHLSYDIIFICPYGVYVIQKINYLKTNKGQNACHL